MSSNDSVKVAIAELERKYGSGIVMRLGDSGRKYEIKTTSTGLLSLDCAMGGGYPSGRIVEIYGPEMCGKTVLGTYALIEVQRAGRQVAVVDTEHTFNPQLAQGNGLDIDSLLFSQPDTGESALDVVEALASTGEFGAIMFDSVAGTLPKQEAEAEIEDQVVGAQPRLFSRALRRLIPTLAKNGCTLLFINQIREKIGVMYGNPEVTPGGRAIKFYSSIRIEMRPSVYLAQGGKEVKTREDAIGHRVRARIVKNKIFPPFKTAEFDLYYGVGFDQMSDIIRTAVATGVISRSGPWYSYKPSSGEELRGQGQKALEEAIVSAGLLESVLAEVKGRMSLGPVSSEQEVET